MNEHRSQTTMSGVNRKDQLPPTEVRPKARRRTFSAAYRLRILEETDSKPGKIGEILRREGLYSSSLTTWRRQRDEGVLDGLSTRKRGPKPVADTKLRKELESLRRRNQRLEERLEKAELIISVQKKVALLLGSPIDEDILSGKTS